MNLKKILCFFKQRAEFIILPFLFVQNTYAENHWETKEWLRLGHYQSGTFSGYESEADGKPFFLAENGKNNPEAEYKKTIELYRLDPKDLKNLDEHEFCRFPARYQFLKNRENLPARDFSGCTKYQEYKKRMRSKSVSIVFSSYYLNNPSSAFGHTLLRFNKQKLKPGMSVEERNELLDEGVNYAAVPTTSNPLLYAIMGLSGLFRGEFAAIPYFYKVREYNDYESRDLWSYDLNLTDQEINQLEDHIWELGHTYFDYYYLTENCSYHLLTALEAAAPRLDLSSKLPFWVIPSDTMRALMDVEGLVQEITYRPSARAMVTQRLKEMDEKQRKSFFELVKSKSRQERDEVLASHSTGEKVKLLDALLDDFEFRYPKDIIKEKSETKSKKQEVLIERARIGIKSEKFEVKPPHEEMPHLGHRSMRMGAGYHFQNEQDPRVQLEARFALHDLLDPSLGYPRFSEIEFGNVKGSYRTKKKKFRLEMLRLFRVSSLQPISELQLPLSWRVDLASKRGSDQACKNCLESGMDLSGGYSFLLGTEKVMTSFFADLRIAHTQNSDRSPFRVFSGPSHLLHIQFSKNINFSVESFFHGILWSSDSSAWKSKANLRVSPSSQLSFDAYGSADEIQKNLGLGVYVYF